MKLIKICKPNSNYAVAFFYLNFKKKLPSETCNKYGVGVLHPRTH